MLAFYRMTWNEKLGDFNCPQPTCSQQRKCTRDKSLWQAQEWGHEIGKALKVTDLQRQEGWQAADNVMPLTAEASLRTPVLPSHQLGSHTDCRSMTGQSASSQLPWGTIGVTHNSDNKKQDGNLCLLPQSTLQASGHIGNVIPCRNVTKSYFHATDLLRALIGVQQVCLLSWQRAPMELKVLNNFQFIQQEKNR